MALTLYSYWRSSTSYRVRIALALKGIEADIRPINLLKAEQRGAEYLRINPMGGVPSLVTESGVVLTQSVAILEYLEEMYHEPPLMPRDREARAYVRAIMQLIATDMHPLGNLKVMNYVKDTLGHSDEEKLAWIQYWGTQGFAALETLVTQSDYAGSCCYGDSPTLADACLIPQLFAAKRFGVDLSPYPTLTAIGTHCEGLAAFIEAHPDNQPDKPKE